MLEKYRESQIALNGSVTNEQIAKNFKNVRIHHRSEPINMNFVESSLTLFRRVLSNAKVSRHAWLEGKVESNQIQKTSSGIGGRGPRASSSSADPARSNISEHQHDTTVSRQMQSIMSSRQQSSNMPTPNSI
jgi:hypothetical protein